MILRGKESGRTISELIAVLVIMLILTLGGLYIYERVMAKMGAKDLVDEIAAMATKNRLELTHSDRVSRKTTKRDGRGTLTSEPKNNGKDFSITVEPESELVCDELTRTDLLANAGVSRKDVHCPESVTFYFNGDFEEDIWVEDGSSGGHGGGRGRRRSEDDRCPDEHALECDEKGDSTLCESGYYVYNKVCVECPEHCVCDGKIILGAEKGYYKEGRVCKECGPNVLRCNGDKALACVNDYYLKDGECLKCPDNSTTTEYSQQSVPGTGCYCKAGHRLNTAKTGCEEGCDTSSDCPTEQPVCYEEKKDCDKCESNYGGTLHSCPTEKMPLCDEGRCRFCPGNTVWNATQKMCKECSETDLSQCPTDKPYCKNDEGTCVECLGNYGTGDGSCPTVEAPICQNNACVACPGETPHWNGTTCVECLAHTHCQEGKKCDDGNTCQDCEQNTLCATCPADTPYWDGEKCFVCPEHSSTTLTSWQIGTTGCYCEAGYIPNEAGDGCIEGKACATNADCGEGNYCHYDSSSQCVRDTAQAMAGITGICKPIGNYSEKDVLGLGALRKSAATMNWWSAKNWCSAQKQSDGSPWKLIDISGTKLGCYRNSSGAVWNIQSGSSGDFCCAAGGACGNGISGQSPIMQALRNAFGSDGSADFDRDAWTDTDKDDCYVFVPEFHSGQIEGATRNGMYGNHYYGVYPALCETGKAVATICTKNTDCSEGEYCDITAPNCSLGTCKKASSVNTNIIEYIYKNKKFLISDVILPNWSEAQAWCASLGKKPASLADLDCPASDNSYCTDLDAILEHYNDSVHSLHVWFADHDETCKAYYTHLKTGHLVLSDYNSGGYIHGFCFDGEISCPDNSSTTIREGAQIGSTSCYCEEGYVPNDAGTGCKVGCSNNKGCESGYYCDYNFWSCGSYEEVKNSGTGSCKTLGDYVDYDVPGVGKIRVGTPILNWWSAKSWCNAQGMDLIDKDEVGIIEKIKAVFSEQPETGWCWTDNASGNDECTSWCVIPSTGGTDTYHRNGSSAFAYTPGYYLSHPLCKGENTCPANSSTTVREGAQIGTSGCYCNEDFMVNDKGTGCVAAPAQCEVYLNNATSANKCSTSVHSVPYEVRLTGSIWSFPGMGGYHIAAAQITCYYSNGQSETFFNTYSGGGNTGINSGTYNNTTVCTIPAGESLTRIYFYGSWGIYVYAINNSSKPAVFTFVPKGE